ncbi:MAG: hypothetical protein K2Y18_08015 [Alphaproteobacteria bacterium]|jgi:uncharacterized protein (DUF1015 family)|nr:hypothetical protein [Alphaproteobacteria bacterium]
MKKVIYFAVLCFSLAINGFAAEDPGMQDDPNYSMRRQELWDLITDGQNEIVDIQRALKAELRINLRSKQIEETFLMAKVAELRAIGEEERVPETERKIEETRTEVWRFQMDLDQLALDKRVYNALKDPHSVEDRAISDSLADGVIAKYQVIEDEEERRVLYEQLTFEEWYALMRWVSPPLYNMFNYAH